jgi:hypothetical protein
MAEHQLWANVRSRRYVRSIFSHETEVAWYVDKPTGKDLRLSVLRAHRMQGYPQLAARRIQAQRVVEPPRCCTLPYHGRSQEVLRFHAAVLTSIR